MPHYCCFIVQWRGHKTHLFKLSLTKTIPVSSLEPIPKSKFTWKVTIKNQSSGGYDAEKLPVGLSVEQSETGSVLIYGTPKFTGRWCFTLEAEDAANNYNFEKVCLHSADNDSLYYPKYGLDEPNFTAIEDQLFEQYIDIDREEIIEGGVATGQIPPGIRYDFNPRTEKVEIVGRPTTALLTMAM